MLGCFETKIDREMVVQSIADRQKLKIENLSKYIKYHVYKKIPSRKNILQKIIMPCQNDKLCVLIISLL